MNLKKIIFLFALIAQTFVYSQREAGIWYFGREAGIDFNSGTPVIITNGKLITKEGCSSISDIDGNLQFYTDGSSVWNSNHQIMPNGAGLLGHSSSTQSAIIVPNPINPNIYYVFTVDQPNDKENEDKTNDGLNYSEINMTLNGGLGDVVSSKKNIHLTTYNPNIPEDVKFKCSEKITAVQHANGNSYWVITHFKDSFYAFEVTSSGVNSTPIISKTNANIPTGGYLPNGQGYLKSSPNGKKLAIAHMAVKNNNNPGPKGGIVRNTGKVFLYNFNNSNGQVSGELSLLGGVNPYGIEFSGKSQKLYVTANFYNNDGTPGGSNLFQYDMESSNIVSSKVLISKNTNVAGALQLAIDEKIYRAGYSITDGGEGSYLSIIHNPEAKGTACKYSINDLFLNGKKSFLGLPPFIQSLFLSNFKYEFTCFGDNTHFFISSFDQVDSVLWDFGDGNTSTDVDAYHTYKAPGTYTVSLIKVINGEAKSPVVKEVVIKERPLILSSTFQLTQCDIFDSNTLDGISMFNLENSIEAITLNNSNNYNVFFYVNDVDATNDIYNSNSLPINYINTSPNQIITAKVVHKNGDCYSLGKIELIANPSLQLIAEDFVECDLGDGTANFDFNLKEEEIILNQSLPSTISINFYPSEEDMMNNTNKLVDVVALDSNKIFFNAEENGNCYGAGSFKTIVNYFPELLKQETLYVCKNDFPIYISPEIPINIRNNYSYSWDSSEASYEIKIENEQQITVTVTDNTVQCNRTKTFDIVEVNSPTISDIIINQQNVIIKTSTNFNNEYTLDSENSIFQFDNTFFNVNAGEHEAIVKNQFGCEPSNKSFYILGFPKYFTPNNDGLNDTWQLLGVDEENFVFSNVDIYDRFGKHLITLKPKESWNGIYNGNHVLSNDYWFTVTVTSKENFSKIYKGHFSLIR